MCLMDVALLPTPFPATPLYHDDRQDLIVHLIKASAAHSEIVCPLKSGDGVKILKSAKRGWGAALSVSFLPSVSSSDTLGYFLVTEVSSCLASRTLSVACHGDRVSWSSHHGSPVSISLLPNAFSSNMTFSNLKHLSLL